VNARPATKNVNWMLPDAFSVSIGVSSSLSIVLVKLQTVTEAAESSWTNILVVGPFAPPDQSLSGRGGFAQ
jgi:hypothetical protein